MFVVLVLILFYAFCVVPENIHTPPTEGIGNSGEDGVSTEDPKI